MKFETQKYLAVCWLKIKMYLFVNELLRSVVAMVLPIFLLMTSNINGVDVCNPYRMNSLIPRLICNQIRNQTLSF